ncbi:prepilin-type N-terminal cleavage/methylation domain-containing protein [Pectobacterium parmentieri]|uniref:General secretion pathway protein G n=1 Tax=Pectobacterium parmentieri TaxID=1905730 RepID=A0A0H3I4M9_PECPM|nr:prepilin-type N-terminal cleavage/methylation domain-containing protein [Pectobacterium parmentieri]AFI89648.1 General secretion pathway protein G [Pectobacterium parmentieri]MBI0472072.1 prepilin-type N-terminal cleavage/methylation domain-containing protein [Pectobacterium parmentieri]MBI0495181.1 prepilin-type N-terminal cleavage/methylation domain-containing protein [Pectobacterium parmentieri]MBI0556233.1 prepilin-type N-terminal cleavage/methylation domain-containing protein [Pectobact
MRNGEKGFTLIELLVVMAIIATLMTLVAPRFFSQTERAKQVVQAHNLNALHSALDAFRRDRLVGPEHLDELVQAGYLRQLPLDPVNNRRDSWNAVTDDTGQITDITLPSQSIWTDDNGG